VRTAKGYILATLISLCLIGVSCENQGHSENADRNQLHALLSEINIMQIRGSELENIAYFDNIKRLDQSRTFNFDTDHVQVIIRVQRAELEQFQAVQSAIQVEGDVQYTLMERDEFPGADWTRVYIDITNIQSSFHIVLGNAPSIELVHLGHNLTYHVATEKLQQPYVVLNNGLNNSKLVLVSKEEGQLTFEFSDPIDQVSSIVAPTGASNGEWVGKQQYKISFSDQPLMQVLFDQVYSSEGAYVAREPFPYLNVRWVPERQWYSYPDNKQLGFSPRDRFYDFLLLSPNPDQYVGLIDTVAAINDGNSYNYAFILERINQEPYMITSGNGLPGMSGMWIDNNVFLYWTTERVMIVHTDTLEQEVLFEQSPNLGRISEVVYDKSEHKLMITVLVGAPESAKYTIDIWQSTNLSTPVLLDSPAHPFEHPIKDVTSVRYHDKGMLVTGIVDILPITVFVDQHKREYEASGQLFMVNGDNVVLFQQKNGSEQYVIWNLQKPNKEPIAIAKAPGNIRIFGSHLIAVQLVDANSQEKQYYEYIASQNNWKPMTLSGIQPYVPYQGVDAIYRSE
jgi:hypothetical protein